MQSRSLRRRSRELLLATFLLALPAPPLPAIAGDGEANIRPGVNEKYLAPDLDIDHWKEIFEGESREIFRSRREIVGALGLEPGMRVADIGAGTGLFLEPLAKAVGPEGRVYAVDISPVFVEHLKRRAARAGLSQVAVVQSRERSAGLPEASVDLIFLCDVYHHFEYPRSTMASLERALRPGGWLVVIDFERIPGESRDWILDHVRAGKREVTAEIAAAGFLLEDEVKVEGLRENYLLRLRKP